jgi:uncharacterized integral membrane protein (TIGR00698 family)
MRKGVEKTRGFLQLVPGVVLAVSISILAVYLHSLYKPISAAATAIVAGVVLRNTFGIPELCKPGQAFAVKKLLRLGIILLGVRLSFMEVLEIGEKALVIIVCCITLAIILVQYISRKIGLPDRLGTLIGVGTSICGVSAIVATSPVIDANEDETAFAVATITIFGLLAVVIYPIVGHLLQMSDVFFGTWAGTAVNDTSQVVATGFIYSDTAGNVATVVKLTRNLFMAPVMLILSSIYMRKKLDDQKRRGEEGKKANYAQAFPLFLLGFIGMVVLRTLGVFPSSAIALIKTSANFIIVTAIAGVGMGTNFASMKNTGLKPFYAGLCASVIMAVISFSIIRVLKIG